LFGDKLWKCGSIEVIAACNPMLISRGLLCAAAKGAARQMIAATAETAIRTMHDDFVRNMVFSWNQLLRLGYIRAEHG
jgi:hypothetical protein